MIKEKAGKKAKKFFRERGQKMHKTLINVPMGQKQRILDAVAELNKRGEVTNLGAFFCEAALKKANAVLEK